METISVAVTNRDESSPKIHLRALRRDMTVRQVAHDIPACRSVFIRYGEPADRVPFGHLESVARFAKRHNVSLATLMLELSQASGLPVDWRSPVAEKIHRPFLTAALAFFVTVGAGWGVWLLWTIGSTRTFDGVPTSHVVAHGDAQLWGFVALFIAGIAVRWLPPACGQPHVPLPMAWSIWGGLVGGTLCGWIWALWPSTFGPLAWLSGALFVLATLLLCALFWLSTKGHLREPWTWGVLAAGGWSVVWAGWVMIQRMAASSAGPADFSTWARDVNIALAVFGVAVNAVYGFGQRMLPGLLGGSVLRHRAALAIVLHNTGLGVLLAAGALSLDGISTAGLFLLLAGGAVYASAYPGLRHRKRLAAQPEQGPPAAYYFIPLALFWLAAGVGLLTVGMVWALAAGEPLSHAWRGAARHALTVGFVTTMIMGVAHRLVPILTHRPLVWPAGAIVVLLLVAVGNLLRVTTELATLRWEAAFGIMPASGLMEWLAGVIFAANIWWTMWAKESLGPSRLGWRTSVASLLEEYPELEDQLIRWGFDYVARVRRIPQELTLGTFASSNRQDPDELLCRIRRWLDERRAN